MDSAVVGVMRVGYFRVGVFKPIFDEAVERLEKAPMRTMGGVDPALADYCRADYCHADVYVPVFYQAAKELEK